MLDAISERLDCVMRSPLTAEVSACPRPMTRYFPATASAQHVEDVLHHLIAGGDDAGIRRVGRLRDDQLGELVGDVDVRALERRADDLARRAEDRRTGTVGDRERAAAERHVALALLEIARPLRAGGV